MKKFICDIQLAGSNDKHPRMSFGYEYFVRAETAIDAFEIIKLDLGLISESDQKIIELYLHEVTGEDIPFPKGNGIVAKRGPIDLIIKENQSLWQNLKEMFKR
jgi:hypothetical protein